MNKKKNIIICGILVLISIIYTVLVKYVDVQAIGPNGSSVGFAWINKTVSNLIGTHMALYKLTKYLGYLALMIAFNYALLGVLQLFKRKSLLKIDKEIIVLGVFYVVVIGIYIFFEKVIINYRPVIMDRVLEASYPSSHTLLALFVCGSAVLVNNKLFKDFNYKKEINIFLLVLLGLIVVGRLISGVHWFSDVLGGIIIGCTILYIFNYMINKK